MTKNANASFCRSSRAVSLPLSRGQSMLFEARKIPSQSTKQKAADIIALSHKYNTRCPRWSHLGFPPFGPISLPRSRPPNHFYFFFFFVFFIIIFSFSILFFAFFFFSEAIPWR
jgi:hypothetical protein